MAPLLSHRPTRPSRRSGSRRPEDGDLTLTATDPDAEPTVALTTGPEPLPVSWPVAAPLAGVGVAAVGWLIVTGLTVIGWLSVDAETAAGPLSSALHVGTQVWAYANGTGLSAGGLRLTLVPWGAVALFAFLLNRSTAFVATRTAGRSADRAGESPRRTAAAVAVLSTFGYLAPLAVLALLLGAPAPSPQSLVVGLVLFGAALWGSLRALHVDVTDGWPGWLRPLPTAVVGTQLVLLAAGSAVVVAAVLGQLTRIDRLADGLGAGVAGGIALLFGQLAFAPTLMVWGGSYALGAGFGLGDGSVVAPASTSVGLLPGLPVFGAIPSSGPGDAYQLLWLVSGVVAGVVAAWLVVRRRPAARFDETALVGGLAGVVGALVFTAVAWACSGDLGVARLTGLGPRLPELVVMAVSTLGLSGMVAGLAIGVWRWRPRRTDPVETDDDDPEQTVSLDREGLLTGSR